MTVCVEVTSTVDPAPEDLLEEATDVVVAGAEVGEEDATEGEVAT